MRTLRGHPRLLLSVAIAAAAAVILAASPWPDLERSSRSLVVWNVFAVSYLVLAFVMMARSDMEGIRRRAAAQDEGAVFILLVTSFAAVASLVAIAVELHAAREAASGGKALRIGLAGLTVLCSWLFVHTSFALHYAHEFYGEGRDKEIGGLQFPKKGYEPDYWDFLYFSANLGAAAQTSDVMITSAAMRRLALAHTILSFLFNTTILALAVNVGASLLS
ncbi:MAG TPA: DUF1345 domain-containing protein [Beijerinckiaceae bacterium]